ncbi:MAG: hypothetical protein IH596_02320, partial [Bacteroidales bacterium]|nr:hypothetical protein [Bacteroidales bacterium]
YKGWGIPEKYKTMKNPVAGDAASADLGKELYAKYCKACNDKMPGFGKPLPEDNERWALVTSMKTLK